MNWTRRTNRTNRTNRANLATAAATYTSLKGLLVLPAGVMIILSGLTNMDLLPWARGWVYAAAALLAVAAYLVAARHYDNAYGRVSLPAGAQARTGAITLAGAVLMVGGVQSDWSLDLPVNGTAAAFALIMIAGQAGGRGLRRHHLVLWGAVLAAALVPLWSSAHPGTKINVGLVLAGAALIASGLLDHRALTRGFPAPADPDA